MVRGPVRRKAYEAAAAVQSAALAYKDGVAIDAELDLDALIQLVRLALAGQLKGKVRVPLRLIIDPSVVAKK